ncbi:MAG: pentapeptide repeat-containing protein [Solirubrobacteraceae bacterium]|jgi:hypothetical protein
MSSYLTRLRKEQLTTGRDRTEDRLFINQLFDGQTLRDGLYLRCTFANISFKSATLDHVRFSACVFEDCYFRETTIKDCKFSGTRFINCDFIKPTISGCDVKYARFKGCFPPFDEMDQNLPGEWNIRAAMAANLSAEAASAGDAKEARKYLLDSIRSNERHLKAAFDPKTKYYQDHFPRWRHRWRAFRGLVFSRMNGFIWGYGERGLALLRSVFLTVLLFFALFWITQESIHTTAGHEANVGDWAWLSAASIVSNSGATGLTVDGWARAFVLLEGGAGLLLLGLFVTYVYRAVTRR